MSYDTEFYNSLIKYSGNEIQLNLARSQQMGNFCYLIAALELLLSCDRFIQLINYTRGSEFADTIYNYIHSKAKKDFFQCRQCLVKIEDIILSELDEKNRFAQEDVNVLFLYLEKLPDYLRIFNKFYYCLPDAPRAEEKEYGFFSIIAFPVNNKNLTCDATMSVVNIPKVFGVSFYLPGHYEIYQRVKFKSKTRDGYIFIPKNTSGFGPMAWKLMYILCRADIQEQIKKIIL